MQGEKHKEIRSTQSLLKERLEADSSLPHGYYVMAQSQTEGRGRGNHPWVSLPGNLLVSILLRELPFQELTWIPHWVSVCVLNALTELGVNSSLIQLKWPNDLWIEGSKKTGGILCEKKGDVIFVGIGLNLNASPEISQETGSISQISDPILPEDLLENIIKQLLSPTSISTLREIYEKHALFKAGERIEWRQDENGALSTGSIVGLGLHGELLVLCNDETIPLFVEDVRAVRLS